MCYEQIWQRYKKCRITTFWPATLKEKETGDFGTDKNKHNINLTEMG